MTWLYWIGWITFGSFYRSFCSLRIDGTEHLIREGPVLVASNHQSFLDPPLIGNLYQTPMHYLARKTLFRGLAKWVYPRWNAIPVDQQRPDMGSLKTIIRLLRQGERVLVFPEGERSMDGSIGTAAPGIGLIAAKAGVPIQPVRIRGASDVLPRGSSRIRRARIHVTIGPAIYPEPADPTAPATTGKAGYERTAKQIMAAISAL